MDDILLVHWKDEEAEERLAALRRLGFAVRRMAPEGMASLRGLRSDPPAAVIIDLARLPSHGRAVAVALRQQKATRLVPLVFAGGEPEKVEATRALLPDAVYARWEEIGDALKAALRAGVPARAVVPDTMAGYAGTPLWRKLGARPGTAIALLGAPAEFERQLEPMPEGIRIIRRTSREARVSVLFARNPAEMKRRFDAAYRALAEGSMLWIAWRKQGSGASGGLTANSVRAYGLQRGLVDFKICAVDETWSGLCFTHRRRK